MSTSQSLTPQQTQAISNLTNMQALNDHINSTGGLQIVADYLTLKASDSTDPGLSMTINALESAFWAIGGILAINPAVGALGGFAAAFLSGIVANYSTETPSSLEGAFSSFLNRFQGGCAATDVSLDKYIKAVKNKANWTDIQYTYNGKTASLGDLSTGQFPPETDDDFLKMSAAALFALRKATWTWGLQCSYVITYWPPPVSAAQFYNLGQFYEINPSYYMQPAGENYNKLNIGTGAGLFGDGGMNIPACTELFIDGIPGETINPNGLFSRATVFTGLGIKEVTYNPF
jgi:hypothetical protein